MLYRDHSTDCDKIVQHHFYRVTKFDLSLLQMHLMRWHPKNLEKSRSIYQIIFIMKNLNNFKKFRLNKSELKSLMGSANYYCWNSAGDLGFYDNDHTGGSSESGLTIYCSPVATVSATRN